MNKLISIILAAACIPAMAQEPWQMERKVLPQTEIESNRWTVSYDSTGIRKAVDKKDPYAADIIGERNALGRIVLKYKVKDGVWLTVPDDRRTMEADGNSVTYTDHTIGNVLLVTHSINLDGDKLKWDIHIQNNSRFPILIGDLAVEVPWNSHIENDETDEVFQQTFTKHAFVSGDASFFYFTRLGGEAPYPVLLPAKGTPLEYFSNNRGQYLAYIRSGKSGNEETRGTWRQEQTWGHLSPAGEDGSTLDYSFILTAADSYKGIRDILYENGSIDTKVVPGMTLPRGQKGSFYLRTKCAIDSVTAEYPLQTRVSRREGEKEIWDVEFDRLGENKLTVWFDGGRKTYLEFFSSLSPEELIKKRSNFLTEHQQWKDTGKWYDGLYSVYDMVTGQLRGPDNPDYFDERLTYFLASDDPILGKAPFVASKNAVFPDKKEIESLEYHIQHFVWGGLQRTDKETPLEYGVYGTPNWYINRHPDLRATYSEYKLDKTRVWRTYDYPHVIMLWWEMYKIASRYPELCTLADADEYLKRAYKTTLAYFRYPTKQLGEYYETFKWGAYNENIIPELIDELDAKGMAAQADSIRADWEKKVKYFVYDTRYPYRSEYATDRTAFESTFALADYGMKNNMKPDHNLWFDQNKGVWYSHPSVKKEDIGDFMQRQFLANLSCRGVLENQWDILGGDFLNSSDWSVHSYMARMGGWGVLEYGLHYANNPYDAIRLGYSSYLDPFGLVNAGDEASDYGYWHPGKEKDGAMGQAFTSLKFGSAWIGTQEPRGPWRYCGEGDLGMCAVTRTAEAILAEDPDFGWTIYGGRDFRQGKEGFSFIPDDGTRTRIAVVSDKKKYEVKIDRDNWSEETPVKVSADLKSMELTLTNGSGTSHSTSLSVNAPKAKVLCDGKRLSQSKDKYGNLVYSVPVDKATVRIKLSF